MSTDLSPGEQYLYLVEFVDHGVKVGISADPVRRLAQHMRDAEAYGRLVGRTWISPTPQGNARANERAIKGSSRREYLKRSFEECVGEASALPAVRLDPVEVSARSDAVTNLFKSIVMGGALR